MRHPIPLYRPFLGKVAGKVNSFERWLRVERSGRLGCVRGFDESGCFQKAYD